MSKIIKIDSCSECPECGVKMYMNEGKKYYCYQACQFIGGNIVSYLPDWCPLEELE